MSVNAIGRAQQHIQTAVNHSSDGQVHSCIEHLERAGDLLRDADLGAFAAVVEDISHGDICIAETRHDLRQIAQLLDCETEPGFRAASELEQSEVDA